MTPLIGRAREREGLERARGAGATLVTLWGPGGAGKTTLARAYARALEGRGASVVWVSLANARDRDACRAAIAAALRLAGDGTDDDLARAAAAAGATVVLDNLEQLDAGARALVARLAAEPGASLVATSREPLGCPGEAVVELGPLPTEDARALLAARSDVALDGAEADEIARRVDGLPLALELAAARLAVLGPRGLLERLRTSYDVLGDAALRAIFAWSWQLLDPVERTALLTCATFEGPFDAALAEQVAATASVLDALEGLRRKALLHAVADEAGGAPRLRLPEAVRSLARERLGEDPSASELARRHAAAVVARARPLAERVARGEAVPKELTELRDDLLRALDVDDVLAAGRALTVLLGLSLVVGGAADVRARAPAVVRALATRGGDGANGAGDAPADARRALAALHVAVAAVARAEGRLDDAHASADAALALAAATETTAIDARRVLAGVARARGDTDAAAAELGRAREDADALGDLARAGLCVGELGAVLQSAGRLAEARRLHADAIAHHVATGARRAEGVERSFFAVATHRAGDPLAALPLHQAALAVHREVGHPRLEGAELLHLAYVQHELDAVGPARDAFAAAAIALAAAGAPALGALAEALHARLDVDRGEPTSAELHLAAARRLAPPGFPRVAATLALVEGHLAFAEGRHADAAARYAEAHACHDGVEVGFEALTPAYEALARTRGGAPAQEARAALDAARAKVARFECPALAVALALIEAAIAGAPLPDVGDAARTSSEVRRALRFVGRPAGLRLGAEGRTVTLPDGTRLDLGRRRTVRLVLVALARARREHPGAPVAPESLLAAGWPGERMRPEAASKRLHTAVWTLRSLGFEALLRTDERGYFLAPDVPLEAPPDL